MQWRERYHALTKERIILCAAKIWCRQCLRWVTTSLELERYRPAELVCFTPRKLDRIVASPRSVDPVPNAASKLAPLTRRTASRANIGVGRCSHDDGRPCVPLFLSVASRLH